MDWRRAVYAVFLILVAGASAILGAFAGGTMVYRAMSSRINATPAAQSNQPASSIPSTGAVESAPSPIKVSSSDIQTDITQAVEKIGPAVVTVIGEVQSQGLFGQGGSQTVSGSGVFISQDGYVLTNNHVVEGADQVRLVLQDGSEMGAQVVNTDAYADLAVLKADQTPPASVTFGDSDKLQPGETVIAIGSPLGDFKNTVTVGVVSATGRSIETGSGYTIEGLIQTDAAINSGNSGGPLINLAGEVIGINTLVVRGSDNGLSAPAEGLGFAIPANTARAVAGQIISKGYFARPYLGIRWQPITPDIAQAYNLPVQWGAFISEVVADSPAVQAGLQQNDIITKVGDQELGQNLSFINALFNYQPGQTIPLEILRNGQHMTLQVTVGEAPRQ